MKSKWTNGGGNCHCKIVANNCHINLYDRTDYFNVFLIVDRVWICLGSVSAKNLGTAKRLATLKTKKFQRSLRSWMFS